MLINFFGGLQRATKEDGVDWFQGSVDLEDWPLGHAISFLVGFQYPTP